MLILNHVIKRRILLKLNYNNLLSPKDEQRQRIFNAGNTHNEQQLAAQPKHADEHKH